MGATGRGCDSSCFDGGSDGLGAWCVVARDGVRGGVPTGMVWGDVCVEWVYSWHTIYLSSHTLYVLISSHKTTYQVLRVIWVFLLLADVYTPQWRGACIITCLALAAHCKVRVPMGMVIVMRGGCVGRSRMIVIVNECPPATLLQNTPFL